MNRTDLINAVDCRGLSKKQADALLKDIFSYMGDALADGNDIYIPKFGKFKVKTREPRVCVNLQTGEKMMSEEHNYVKFEISGTLKQRCR